MSSPSVIYFTYFSHANPLRTGCLRHFAEGNNGKYTHMKPSGFTLRHLYSCSRLGKAITTAVKEKKVSCLLPEGAYPAWPCRQYCSILSMALEMQRRSMR